MTDDLAKAGPPSGPAGGERDALSPAEALDRMRCGSCDQHKLIQRLRGELAQSRLAFERLLQQRLSEAPAPADLLRRAAAGRREYAGNAPDKTRDMLLTEASTFEQAARIVEGDRHALRGALPSWRWDEPTSPAPATGDLVEAERAAREALTRIVRALDEVEGDPPGVTGLRMAIDAARPLVPSTPAASEPGGESNDDPDASTAERRLPSPMLEPTSFDDTETEDELVPAPARPADPAEGLRGHANHLAEMLGYLLAQYERVVEMHSKVVMDTDEDRAAHERVVEAARKAADPVREQLDRWRALVAGAAAPAGDTEPVETREEWGVAYDDAISVLRALVAYDDQTDNSAEAQDLWEAIMTRARALVARADQAGGETRAGSPRVGRDRVEAAARYLHAQLRNGKDIPYADSEEQRFYELVVANMAAALGVAVDPDDEGGETPMAECGSVLADWVAWGWTLVAGIVTGWFLRKAIESR